MVDLNPNINNLGLNTPIKRQIGYKLLKRPNQMLSTGNTLQVKNKRMRKDI